METEREFLTRLVNTVPSGRQIHQQELEFYAFFHFSINTFTGREWGDGTENPALFSPSELDAGQWVRAVKAAGMKAAILTCKHHDGFCLWPSRYTAHTVASSPYQNGAGDVVREVALACRNEGLEFGIYLSPWDRNQEAYGTGVSYDDYFVNQLTELLTGYGPVFCVWLDGACGEGKNGKVQRYDWERYYRVIRELQPDACISVCGPDVRWCGNETGDMRPEEWSVVPKRLMDTERIKELSQQNDDEAFRGKKISASDLDLGSRKALAGEKELIWYPAEVDVSIRPGWFYHEEENEQVRSLKELIEIYDGSVGGNAMLLLNIPPDQRGLVHESDKQRLEELGAFLKERTRYNLTHQARVDFADGLISVSWDLDKIINCVILKEDIRFGQRVEAFELMDQFGAVLYEGRTIGHQKIVVFPEAQVRKLHVRITQARDQAIIGFLGVY